jgi:hypothetical protein
MEAKTFFNNFDNDPPVIIVEIFLGAVSMEIAQPYINSETTNNKEKCFLSNG